MWVINELIMQSGLCSIFRGTQSQHDAGLILEGKSGKIFKFQVSRVWGAESNGVSPMYFFVSFI